MSWDGVPAPVRDRSFHKDRRVHALHFPAVSAPDDDETRLGPPDDSETRLELPRTPSSNSDAKPVTSSSGWLSSSGAIDHGRFPPGTLLGGRYRIVGRLGRGGMGEVYRADDLKLGQPVALKFLPGDVDRDPARLTQLHTEVRMARQVSHPNVCRVYDIDEVEGHSFISMEYVDGEDLASLLRRIGRFPEDRAVAISRQICAGLAAAHERGVVHRDLKPANVMLDGSGKVRITDFGLAGVAGEAVRAGTPAYMAPEQLSGGEVTPRSDIYALGLVLYEVFTGQRALEGETLAELIRKREQSGILPPSAIVRDIDPEVDAAIMRCLRPDPAHRPASAIAVSAGLPGGDPLAAALAAGETPSPEMVAAAGASDALGAHWVGFAVAWIGVALVALAFMYQRVMLINFIPTPKQPAALEDRATEMLGKLGYDTTGHASASGLTISLDYARFIASRATGRDRWKPLANSRPETLVFWHRTSPRPLVPWDDSRVSGTNPPLNVSGMTLILVDASGRLSELVAIPEPFDSGGTHPPANWSALFEAAALPMSAFTPVTPTFNPIMFVDERMAWEGRLNEGSEHVFRIEAAAYKGKPVSFEIIGPWSRSSRSQPPAPSAFDRVVNGITSLVMPGLMVAAILLARKNITLGRGDRRGAMRAASVVLAASLIAWLLGTTHFADLGREINRFFARTGDALFQAGLMWVTYLGIEPYVRRFSPDSLIGWTRIISGRWRDPEVGRDILIGISAGLAMTVLYAAHNLIPPLFGRPEPMPLSFAPTVLLGPRYVLSGVLAQFANAITSSMLAVVGIVAILIFVKRAWVAWLAGVAIFVWVVIQGMFSPGTPMLDLAIGCGIIGIFIGVILRWGLLATIAALFTHFMLLRAPLTADVNSWRATAGLTHIAVLGGLGLLGAWLSRHRIPNQQSLITDH
jgi:tRNA A-37 threonylcarbamoyl transferase component Bud32